jgi:hypothetical protein
VGLSFSLVTKGGITEMYYTTKTFKVKLWQCENQTCTPLSTFHTWHLLALFIISKIKNVALRRVQQTIPAVQNYECRFFVVSFSSKGGHWEAPENLKMGLINLQCNTSLSHKDFITACQRKVAWAEIFWVKIGSTCVCVCVCEQLFCLTIITWKASRLTDGHLTSVMTVVSIDVPIQTEFTVRAKLNCDGKARTIFPH